MSLSWRVSAPLRVGLQMRLLFPQSERPPLPSQRLPLIGVPPIVACLQTWCD